MHSLALLTLYSSFYFSYVVYRDLLFCIFISTLFILVSSLCTLISSVIVCGSYLNKKTYGEKMINIWSRVTTFVIQICISFVVGRTISVALRGTVQGYFWNFSFLRININTLLCNFNLIHSENSLPCSYGRRQLAEPR